MKKIIGFGVASTLLLVACGSISQPNPGDAAGSASKATVYMITDAGGSLGDALRTTREVSVSSQPVAKPSLLYVSADLTSAQALQSNSALKQALQDGTPVLVEAKNDGQVAALRQVTDQVFNFASNQSAYVVRALPDTDGGFAVYPIEQSGVQASSQGEQSASPLEQAFKVAGLSTQQPESLTESDAEMRVQAPNATARTIHPRCIDKHCIDITFSTTSMRLLGSYSLHNVSWWGGWVVCGGLAVVEQNQCMTTYTRTTQTIKGDMNHESQNVEVGGGGGGEVNLGIVKFNLEASAKGGFLWGKEWRNEQSFTFAEAYNTTIKQGFRARFGRGQYNVPYGVYLHGRYEKIGQRFEPLTPGGQPMKVAYLRWNPTFVARSGWGRWVTYGAMIWVICRNADVACYQKYQFYPKDARLFPL
jgi:hypothetical protein